MSEFTKHVSRLAFTLEIRKTYVSFEAQLITSKLKFNSVERKEHILAPKMCIKFYRLKFSRPDRYLSKFQSRTKIARPNQTLNTTRLIRNIHVHSGLLYDINFFLFRTSEIINASSRNRVARHENNVNMIVTVFF